MLRLKKSPAKSQRKVVRKDQLHHSRSLYNWIVYLKILILENLLSVKKGKLGSKHAENFSRALAPNKNFGKERVHREELSKSVNLMSVVTAKTRGKITWGHLATRKMRPQSGVGLGKKYKLKNAGKATFYTLVDARVMPASTSKRPDEREFVVDSGASMHMTSKKELSSEELNTLRRSRHTTVVLTASGKCIQTRKHRYTFTILSSSSLQLLQRSKARVIHQFWKQFVFNIDITGFVFNKCSPRAKWRTSFRKLDRITQNQNKKRDGNRDSDDRLRDLPEWLEEFSDNLEDTELHAPAHISQDLDQEQKVVSKSRSILFILTSQKTEIAESACEPKRQGLLAEDARWVTKQSPVRCRCSRSWHSMDSILSVQNKDFTRNGKDFTKVPRAVGKTKSYSYWQFIGTWKSVKVYHGIIEPQHLVDPRQMALLKEPQDEWKKELHQYCWFYGVLLLSAKCPRPPSRWENPIKGDSENHLKDQ